MSVANDQLDGAVRNNAYWCDLACRTHGSPGTFADGMPINRGRIPRLYLSAQTITRDGHRQLKLKERAADLLREESAFEDLVLRPT
jgi:UDP:flavonoid glycosyltransferase YjiC (YdhE family)